MRSQIPVFVISSGRSGSTLLARMINRHPRLLCVSDLFEPVGEVPYFDASRRVDGKEFFEILSQPSFQQRIDYWRDRSNAELLFLHEEDRMVSLLLSYTLPFLTDGKPMQLYQELESASADFPVDTMPCHLIRFFEWLRDRFDKDLWVERTGGSLPHTRQIVENWPDAKFVHNYRDCRETAISMMTGSFFRLYLELEKNPLLGEWDFDAMPPLEEMAAMLNRWIIDAMAAFDTVPAAQKLDLSFEELLAEPVETLSNFAAFVLDRDAPSSEDLAWAEQEARVIRPPSLKFPKLDTEEQEKLEAACREGLELLGYELATEPVLA